MIYSKTLSAKTGQPALNFHYQDHTLLQHTRTRTPAVLLTYISDLQRNVNGKQYGLVFGEHRETIDTLLAKHASALTDERLLLLHNGCEMNLLLQSDNLDALRLLEKTYWGSSNLTYIEPSYNTGNKRFVYDYTFVGKNDTFISSKWRSFISERLSLAQRLLSSYVEVFIRIEYQEAHNLVML